MATLIVFGASGGTGAAVVRLALRRGHAVSAFVRSPAGLTDRPAGLRVIEGDVFDAGAVARALPGHDAVVSALGTRPWRHTDVCSVGTRHIVAGMPAAGIRRIVVVSSIGAGETGASAGAAIKLAARTVLKRALADKTVMEDELRASGLDWVIVRPTLLSNGKPDGPVRAATDGSIGGGSIARAAVAEFVLAQLTADTWLRRAPVITSD